MNYMPRRQNQRAAGERAWLLSLGALATWGVPGFRLAAPIRPSDGTSLRHNLEILNDT